eukprot:scaffold465_cov383-Pavlova_lutheri.AAC.9
MPHSHASGNPFAARNEISCKILGHECLDITWDWHSIPRGVVVPQSISLGVLHDWFMHQLAVECLIKFNMSV